MSNKLLLPNIEHYISETPRFTKHVLFWLVYITFFTVLYGSFNDDYLLQLQRQLLHLPAKLLVTYTVIYWILPKYLLHNRYLSFFLWLFAILLIGGMIHWAVALYLEQPLFYPNDDWGVPFFHIGKIIKSTTGIYPVVTIAVVIKLFKRWYAYQQTAQQLSQDKLEAELKFLKAQIHPHFLFNTLNNLYALTLKKSEKAPDIVLRLSELLNYMLYDCNARWVALKKEIELLENYLALEKIRYGDRLEIVYHVRGEVGDKTIAPLLILPFVENSFKHGVSGETEKAWVSIDITVSEHELVLKVDNSKSNHNGKEEQDYKEGIGLTNVKRRLDLLYSDNYELKCIDAEDSYLVVLKLNWQSVDDK